PPTNTFTTTSSANCCQFARSPSRTRSVAATDTAMGPSSAGAVAVTLQRAPTAVLGVPDHLTDINADERRRRLRHATELVEGRLRGPGVFFSIEEPERMLDDVALVAPRPVAARGAGHAPQHRDTSGTDHRQRLVRPGRHDLDPSDDCVHESALPAVIVRATMTRRPGLPHR